MKRGAYVTTLSALAVLLANGVSAQDLPAVTSVEPVTAAKLDLANQIIEASGTTDQMQARMREAMNQVATSMSRKLPADERGQVKVFFEAESDALARRTPDIRRALVQSYAATYSDQELSDILAFYKSPSGRAIVIKGPMAMQDVMASIIKILPEIQRDAGAEACAKIRCTAAQKAAFMGESAPMK